MKPALLFVLAALSMAEPAAASKTRSTHSLISGFRYVTCVLAKTCVEIQAPKAWVSLLSGGFSTEGKTEMRILDTNGKVTSTFEGTSATFNTGLEVITLENGDQGFLLHSLRDGSTTNFGGPNEKK